MRNTMKRPRAFTRLASLIGLILGLVAVGSAPAAAAPLFKAPFECGTTWGASTYSGHGNAADFNMPGTANGDAGKPVLASAAGTVIASTFHSVGGNYVIVDHGGGWSTYYGHLRELRVTRGQRVSSGQFLGTVGSTGSATGAHVHYEQRFNGAGQLPIRFDGAAIAIGSAPPGPTFTSTNCSGAVAEGSFVANRGHVYRIAGGAPVYVSAWSHVGGQQPVTNLSDAAFDALPQYPRDGTLVAGRAPGSPDDGTVYVIAGGAPVYLSNYAHIGGDRGTVSIDLAAIHNAGTSGVWSHLRYQPADGTVLDAADTRYQVHSGAPYRTDLTTGGVRVDPVAIANAGGPGRWSHLAAPLSISATAVKRASAMRMQVKPFSAARNFTVRIQRKVRGVWKNVGRATTAGPRDIRVLDLRAGIYRAVLVTSYTRVSSAAVRLRR